MDAGTILIETHRGGYPENRQTGWLAITDSNGCLLHSTPAAWEISTFFRSAAKPFQSLPLVVAGLHRQMPPEMLALTTASHSATPEHLGWVNRLLAMTDLPLSALQCGPHLPIDEAAKEALLARGESPTAIHNNCSGKHAGMLLMCRHAGYPIESYLEPEHPLQQQILTGLCQWTELTGIPTAIDGCGAPVFYLPLTAIARLYAQLVRHELFAPIVQVMTAYPHLVGGQGRVDTTLMQVSAGRLLAKVGADGLIAVAHREREQGLALKMASGSNEYRNLYIVWALAQMGWLTAEELASPLLQPFQVLDITNTQGRIVGAHQFFLPLVS